MSGAISNSKFQIPIPLALLPDRVYLLGMVDPVAFHIPFWGHPVYWYGIFVALGFFAALMHWSWTARRVGMPKGFASDLAFVVMFGGLLGARALYVMADWSYFSANPAEIIRIDQGGLVFYGGFLAAALAVIVLARVRKIPVLKLGDFTVSALPLGHAFGRIGCLLNGCCYGATCDLPWAVNTAGAMRHPVQAYEALFNLLLYLVLLNRLLKGKRDGWIIAIYLIGYGAWRFTIEFWRGDERLPAAFGLDAAQNLSLALIAVGVFLAIALQLRARRRSS